MEFGKAVQRRWKSVIGAAGAELVVNGERLTAAEIDEFKRITGVRTLTPGRYWLNLDTGDMGYEGERDPRLNVFVSLPPR